MKLTELIKNCIDESDVPFTVKEVFESRDPTDVDVLVLTDNIAVYMNPFTGTFYIVEVQLDGKIVFSDESNSVVVLLKQLRGVAMTT